MNRLHPRALLIGVALLATGFSVPGPCSFDSHPELDCGRVDLTGVRCAEVDCLTLPGNWDCRDGFCVQDCPDGMLCARDGFCKPSAGACADDDFICGGHCLAPELAAIRPQLCCGTCGEGEECCEHGGGANLPACVDTQSDADHCGSCDHACVGVADLCVAGQCGECRENADCADPGRTTPLCCDGFCTDGAIDRLHCGVCGEDCSQQGATIYCHGGSCQDRARNDFCGADATNCLLSGLICDSSDPSAIACGTCDPVDPARACSTGFDCTFDSISMVNGTACLPQSSSPLDLHTRCTPSSVVNPCQPGMSCVTGPWGSDAYCVKPCHSYASGDCDGMAVCHSFGGSGGIGICLGHCPCPGTGNASDLFTSCTMLLTETSCTAFCGPAGSVTQDSPCDSVGLSCGAGLSCIERAGFATCRTSCEPGVPCASGTCTIPPECDGGVGFCVP